MEFSERWEAISEVAFLKGFDELENKRASRPDLHAMMLLDELFEPRYRMISGASHEVIYLDIASREFETLTDDQIAELCRCGVHFDAEFESLAMFV